MTHLALETPLAVLREDGDGNLRIAHSRIILDSLVADLDGGAAATATVSGFARLSPEEVRAALEHYLAHRHELDSYLRRQANERRAARAEAERRFPPTSIRARLIARRRMCDASPDR
jgi:uncharacterized protein (DUF433 family)